MYVCMHVCMYVRTVVPYYLNRLSLAVTFWKNQPDIRLHKLPNEKVDPSLL